MSTILINGRFLARRFTGVDRFAYQIVSAFDDLMAAQHSSVRDLDFVLLLPAGLQTEVQFAHIPMQTVGKSAGHAWEQWDLPSRVGAGELLLNLCNTAPAALHRQIVVIHDAATKRVPAAYSLAFRLWYRVLLPLAGRAARRVLTVSEFSRREIADAFFIPLEKITVVSEGAEHILGVSRDDDAIRRFGLESRPFALAVGSMAMHKNFGLVLNALAGHPDIPLDLAIAGGCNSKVFGRVASLRPERVKWLGYVGDAELRALYEAATCFIFPSIYEGFGIPPIEAMQCGCPVLASRAASIPEVCGDAAVYFDPHDSQDLARQLKALANDPTRRLRLSERGRKHAARFTWKQAAVQVLDACRQALGEPADMPNLVPHPVRDA